jgi:hypothetical protein
MHNHGIALLSLQMFMLSNDLIPYYIDLETPTTYTILVTKKLRILYDDGSSEGSHAVDAVFTK